MTAKVEAEVARAIVQARELRKRRVAEYEIRREKRIEQQMKMAEVLTPELDSDDCRSWTTSCEEGSTISLGSGLDTHSVHGTNEMRSLAERADEQDVNHQNNPLIIESSQLSSPQPSSQSQQEMSGEQGSEPIVDDDGLISNEINSLSLHSGGVDK